jgi:hypothetical protein
LSESVVIHEAKIVSHAESMISWRLGWALIDM